jgi:hypothetical protein
VPRLPVAGGGPTPAKAARKAAAVKAATKKAAAKKAAAADAASKDAAKRTRSVSTSDAPRKAGASEAAGTKTAAKKKATKKAKGGATKRVSEAARSGRRITAVLGAAKSASGLSAAVGAAASARLVQVTLPRTGVFAPLASRFAAFATPTRLSKVKTPLAAAMQFTRSFGGASLDAIEPDARALLARLARDLRPALQGIVVGGARADTVVVRDNLVEGTIQGIHVGVSGRGEARLSAGEVMISRNIVHALVPAVYAQDRHAVFVGNARSVHVLDTVATLTRPDRDLSRVQSSVDAVRVQGTLGPFLAVRQTSTQGFVVGVRVEPLAPFPSPKARMWLVAEAMATVAGGRGALLPAVNAPAAVIGERTIP